MAADGVPGSQALIATSAVLANDMHIVLLFYPVLFDAPAASRRVTCRLVTRKQHRDAAFSSEIANGIRRRFAAGR